MRSSRGQETTKVMTINQVKDIQLGRGKALLSIDEWAKFGYCPDCNHQKCDHCQRRTIDISHVFNFLPRDFDFDIFPPKLWFAVIRCCLCGSERHILDWVQDTFWPELFELPEVEKALLYALRRARRIRRRLRV
jgi:hypothetical protein